jgi:S-adenosylmethionine hydrolase
MILEEKPEMIIGIPLSKETAKSTTTITAVMGYVINQLVNGEPILKIGNADPTYQEKRHLRPLVESDLIEGQIVFIDSFENVIVNITQEQFEQERKNRKFRIVFKRDEIIDKISDSYADVPEGEKLALFNSAGYLEIAVNKGNAAGLFGLKGYSEKMMQGQLAYQTVKVYFE